MSAVVGSGCPMCAGEGPAGCPVCTVPAPLGEQQLAEIRKRDELRVKFATAIRECRESGGMSASEIADEVLEVHASEAARQHAALLAEVVRLRGERHSTNEALDDVVVAIKAKDGRIAELERQAAAVAEFVAARAEYITAIRNCHPDNGHDYDRWQGHAESRRQLAETLGLPVAWPAETGGAE